ncbi:MarR family transcriptional regulator [Actinoallomurus purpureus]|uniref:MarR family winged helix-turn-helix transcriptional regulator n=1 Tax=Actinoallomurus purpureus TaxID=478114 RepID=UPI0020920593|nr:MarR family transcriptional regulator [Actinoallomurus purpureus]MCO6003797.1 MarR family transcriptional regulator [Actinoallomurus purpureus]
MDDTADVVGRAATGLVQRMRAERPRDGLTLSMVSVLSHLDRAGPLTPGALAELQKVEPQTMTRTLSRLEAEGLIDRVPDEIDRRRMRIGLTDAGRRRLAEHLRPRFDWLAQAMERLTPTERELLRLAGTLMESLVSWDDPVVAP